MTTVTTPQRQASTDSSNQFGLNMSEYRIKPVTALGGSIKLKDELKVSFHIAGIPEGG